MIPKKALEELQRSPYYVVFLDDEVPNKTTFVKVKDYSEEEYQTFIDARENIEKNILQFNDLFLMVATVYDDFMEAYNNRVEALKNHDAPSARDDLVALNSYFVSFIANFGMYLACVPRKITSKRAHIKAIHDMATNIEYDDNFSYRLIVNLRNYAMHNTPPITGIRGSNWRSSSNEENFEYEIYFEKNKIMADKDIARKLASDFENGMDHYPVVESITEAVKSLNRIHWKTIKALLREVEDSLEVIDSVALLTKKYDKQPYIAKYFEDPDTGLGATLEFVPTHIFDIKDNAQDY